MVESTPERKTANGRITAGRTASWGKRVISVFHVSRNSEAMQAVSRETDTTDGESGLRPDSYSVQFKSR